MTSWEPSKVGRGKRCKSRGQFRGRRYRCELPDGHPDWHKRHDEESHMFMWNGTGLWSSHYSSQTWPT